MGEIRFVGTGETRGHPYLVCKKITSHIPPLTWTHTNFDERFKYFTLAKCGKSKDKPRIVKRCLFASHAHEIYLYSSTGYINGKPCSVSKNIYVRRVDKFSSYAVSITNI